MNTTIIHGNDPLNETDSQHEKLTGIRSSVIWFSVKMEEKLRANDHKGGWKNETLQYLSMRLTQERKELTAALKSKDKERIIKECADIANFAMMIADNFNQNTY